MSKARRRWIGSTVVIGVKGERLEQFVNQAVRAGVGLRRIERPRPDLLVARVEAGDFRRLRAVCRRRPWQARVLHRGRSGFKRLLGRSGLVVGAGLAALALLLLSQRIWFVRLEGAERVSAERVYAVAAESGLRPGVRREDVDRDAVQRSLLMELPAVAWAAVDLRGTLATVRLAERIQHGAALDLPGHIVAARSGVVERVVVVEGEPAVEPGETVQAGQLLVSGLLPPGSEAYRAALDDGRLPYLRASGKVYARVWHEAEADAALEVAELQPKRGLPRPWLRLRLGSRSLALGWRPAGAEGWRVQELSLGGDYGLDLRIAWPVVERRRLVPEAEAAAAAWEAALAQIESELPEEAELVGEPGRSVERVERGGASYVRVRAVVESVEPIGVFQGIDPLRAEFGG